MMDRLTRISHDFAENRDLYYRKQSAQYQADMSYINNAKLYDNVTLNDIEDDGFDDLVLSAAPSTQGSLRQGQHGTTVGGAGLMAPFRPSKHTARFIQDVNDAIEQKDADLVTCAVRCTLQLLPFRAPHPEQTIFKSNPR